MENHRVSWTLTGRRSSICNSALPARNSSWRCPGAEMYLTISCILVIQSIGRSNLGFRGLGAPLDRCGALTFKVLLAVNALAMWLIKLPKHFNTGSFAFQLMPK